jgi:hypothetical protein
MAWGDAEGLAKIAYKKGLMKHSACWAGPNLQTDNRLAVNKMNPPVEI